MPRYDFQSPTAAAGQGIQDILTKRREEARQALLDEITAKNAEQQRLASEENIKSSQENRTRQLFLDSVEGREMGEDLSTLPPELLAEYQRRGMLGANPNPQPKVSTETSIQSPEVDDAGESTGSMAQFTEADPTSSVSSHSNYFQGTKDQRDRERVKGQIGTVINRIMGDTTMDPAQRGEIINSLEAAMATEGQSLPAGFWNALQPREPNWTFDQVTGKWSRGEGYGGRVGTKTRPPQPPRSSYMNLGVTKEGNVPVIGINGVPHTYNDKGQPVPYSGAIAARAAQSGSGRDSVPAAIRNALTNAQRRVAGNTPEQRAMAEEQYISAYPATPNVKDVVRDILASNESEATTIDEIIQAVTEQQLISPEELPAFQDLLAVLKGY